MTALEEGCPRDFAGCIITDDEGRVLLVHQTYGARKWDLPGGLVEQGEAPWEAVAREVREELGIDVFDLTLTGIYFLPAQPRYGFCFRAFSYRGCIRPCDAEIDRWAFFDPADLPPLTDSCRERVIDGVNMKGRAALRVQHRPAAGG